MADFERNYPTDAEIEKMYEDFMSQFGANEEEQFWNYKMYLEGFSVNDLSPLEV